MGFLGAFLPLAITAGLDLVVSLINRPASRSAERLKNKTVNSDAYGQAFPRCRGTVRLQGKLIQSPNNLVEVTHKVTQGGFLGIGGSSFYFYSYTAYPAFAFGKKLGGGPAYNFLRIWADGKLIYNAKVTGASLTGSVTLQTGTPSVPAGTTLATIVTGPGASVNLPAGTDFTFAAEPNILYTVQANFVLGASSSGVLSFWPPVDIDLNGGGAISIPGLTQPFYDKQWFETWAQMEASQGVPHVSHPVAPNVNADLPGSIYFHLGSDTEFPDTVLKQLVGATVQPGYRGLPYVFFNRLKLTQGGSNHIPNITAEIAFDNPAPQYPLVGPIPGVTLASSGSLEPDAYLFPQTANGGSSLPYVFCITPTIGVGLNIYRVNTSTNMLEQTGLLAVEYDHDQGITCDEDGFIYIVCTLIATNTPLIIKYDALSMQIAIASPGIGPANTTTLATYDTVTTDLQGNPVVKKILVGTANGAVFIYDRTTMLPLSTVTLPWSFGSSCAQVAIDQDSTIWAQVGPDLYGLNGAYGPWIPDIANPGNFIQLAPSLGTLRFFGGTGTFGGPIFYMVDDNSVIEFDGGGAANHIDLTTGAILGTIGSTLGTSVSNYADFGTFIAAGNRRSFYRINLSQYVTGGSPFQTTYILDNWFGGGFTSAVYLGPYDPPTHSVWANVGGQLYRVYLDRALSSGIGLDVIVAAILTEAGYDSSQYDVTDLGTISVDGVEFDQESFEDSIKKLRDIYLFDWAEIDGKLVFTLRSEIVTVSIPEADLGAADDPSRYDPRVSEPTQDENDTPRSVWLKYYDETKQLQTATQNDQRISRPYSTALAGNRKVVNTEQQLVISTPVTAMPTAMKQQAEMILADQWMRRPKYQYKLGPKYLQLDATDKRIILYKGLQLEHNIIEADRGTGLGLEFHAEGHDDGVYTSIATSGAGLGGTPVVGTSNQGAGTVRATYNARVLSISDPGVGNTQIYFVTIYDPTFTASAGASYTINPLYPLSQPDATHVDVAQFIATFSSGSAQGDAPGSTSLTALIGTTMASVNYGAPGYIYAGSIIATHTGGAVLVGPGGTGVPSSSSSGSGSGSASTAGASVIGEIPSGAVDGVNTDFGLSFPPIGTPMVFLNGLEQESGTDFTLSGSTVTFTTAPPTGTTVFVYYYYLPSAIAEVPSGTINGSNTTFRLTFAPNPSTSLVLYRNGMQQSPGIDFTLSGNTITMVAAPVTGDVLFAYYRVDGQTSNIAEGETPTGAIDGTNTTFALANTPIAGTLLIFLGGIAQTPGVDYTLAGNTITMLTAPSLGNTLIAFYRF